MEDSRHNSTLTKNPETTSFVPGKTVSQTSLVASRPKSFSKNKFSYRHIASLGHSRIRSSVLGDLAFFLLKVAALEAVRRFSRAKCPFAWRGLQALQLLCYPPLKWLQRWAPCRVLLKGMQVCTLHYSRWKISKEIYLRHIPETVEKFVCNNSCILLESNAMMEVAVFFFSSFCCLLDINDMI